MEYKDYDRKKRRQMMRRKRRLRILKMRLAAGAALLLFMIFIIIRLLSPRTTLADNEFKADMETGLGDIERKGTIVVDPGHGGCYLR